MTVTNEVGPAETPSGSASREQSSGLFERVRALFGLAPASARDDIEDAIEESASEEFTPQERAILKNVLALHDVRVEDVMVPRADVIALSLDTPLSEVLDCFRTAGHSRLPVYDETLDDPRGMIHIRDFVVFLASDPRFGLMKARHDSPSNGEGQPGLDMPLSAAQILRPVLYAPPSMPALDLLLKMQASRTHMALVIDEYGGTDGLVSIEDVMESIVGDIEDEHDEDETHGLHRRRTAHGLRKRARRSTPSPKRPASISLRFPKRRKSIRSAASSSPRLDAFPTAARFSSVRGNSNMRCWTPTRAASSG